MSSVSGVHLRPHRSACFFFKAQRAYALIRRAGLASPIQKQQPMAIHKPSTILQGLLHGLQRPHKATIATHFKLVVLEIAFEVRGFCHHPPQIGSRDRAANRKSENMLPSGIPPKAYISNFTPIDSLHRPLSYLWKFTYALHIRKMNLLAHDHLKLESPLLPLFITSRPPRPQTLPLCRFPCQASFLCLA